MSKYPFGSIIKDKNGNERKVLGECGDVIFVSCIANHETYDRTLTVSGIESLGYTEVKAPWKPEIGKGYACISLSSVEGVEKVDAHWDGGRLDCARLASGNCYNPDDDSADRAVERVNKALKGE